jgi:hypothetical protein
MDSFSMIALNVDPGKTACLDLGCSGRPVIGQLRMPAGSSSRPAWNFAMIEVVPQHPPLQKLSPYFLAAIDRHGGFCIDGVIPGHYALSVGFFNKANGYGLKNHGFAVPTAPEKLSQRPVDLGVLTLEPSPRP